ncbi:MAG: hypothetical protein SFU91_01025 [Chloroherpetonaceae bacterium]|nr:hypothetical protein [Chloroherpetonaceae bacterium]
MTSFKAGDGIRFGSFEGTFGMAKILRIDQAVIDLPTPEPVYHLLVYSLRSIIPPSEAHFAEGKPFIGHLPLLESAFQKSNPEKIAETFVSQDELVAYERWEEAFYSGESGIFDIPLLEAVTIIVESLGIEKRS